MSSIRKVGSLFRQAMPKHTVFNGCVSMPIIYQAFRHMSSSRLFVGGIPYGMDDQSLREAFTEFGDVIEARIILDRDTGRSRGFGFVNFSSSEEATHTISMDGKNLEGRIIHVNYATERTGGFRSSGGEYSQNDGFGSGGGGGLMEDPEKTLMEDMGKGLMKDLVILVEQMTAGTQVGSEMSMIMKRILAMMLAIWAGDTKRLH